MSELLFEIGCEEIPARMLSDAVAALHQGLVRLLAEKNVASGPVECHGTPRRLVAMVSGLAAQQADTEEQRKGPTMDKALTANGEPTPAALGFARSCGVEFSALERIATPKGECLGLTIRRPGAATATILPELLAAVVRALPWPKGMRWGVNDGPFVRPIHSITALFDGRVLAGEIFPGYQNGDSITGHRFMGAGSHPVTGIASCRATLLERKVLLNLQERQALIQSGVERLAVAAGGQAILDPGLLEENACLVEWPVPLLGRFAEKFLEIPKEVLVTSMKNHQKYFPVQGADGRLLPCFVVISNMETPDQSVLTQGFERVLRARLEDAAFFWREDRAATLESRLSALGGVVFQAKLGTVLEKVRRLEQLAEWLAPVVGAEVAVARSAAKLAKCDLITGMVGEFPELQGVMGSYYARHDGLSDPIAAAIQEHYQPQGAADAVPATPAGRAVALADKLDTLIGCFGIGLVPTGTKDPFALRRAALGVIRILLANDSRLSLRSMAERAYVLYGAGVLARGAAETVEALLAFFFGRLQSHLKADGYDYDLIDAVQALGLDDLVDGVARVKALAEFRKSPAYAALVAANKRIANILAKAGVQEVAQPDPARFQEEAERQLAAGLAARSGEVQALAARGAYGEALTVLAGLRGEIDRFFDAVMVMADDPAVRSNRLALLANVRASFNQVADVSRLVLPEEEKG